MSEYTKQQKQVAHAMEVIGQVARLYKRKGQPPVWNSVTSVYNRAAKRTLARGLAKPRILVIKPISQNAAYDFAEAV